MNKEKDEKKRNGKLLTCIAHEMYDPLCGGCINRNLTPMLFKDCDKCLKLLAEKYGEDNVLR